MGQSSHIWRFCLQRPLVIVIIFALTAYSIFVILQIIAGSDNSEDRALSIELSERSRGEAVLQWQTDEDLTKVYNFGNPNDISDLSLRIEDLRKIKLSITNELRSLQREKNNVMRETASLRSKNEKILAQISRSKLQLRQYELDIDANRRQRSDQTCNTFVPAPVVFKPLSSFDLRNFSRTSNEFEDSPAINSGYKLDFSSCKLTQNFKFNVIKDENINDILDEPLKTHRQYSENEDSVCLTVIVSRDRHPDPGQSHRNTLVIDVSTQVDASRQRSYMVASSTFSRATFRDKFDIVIPSILQPLGAYNSMVGSIPLQSPIERKYFASYFGPNEEASPRRELVVVHKVLQTIHRSSIDDMFLFIYNCGLRTNQQCFSERDKMLEMSTFLIIFPDGRYDIDQNTNDLIYMALSRGTIPVLIGKDLVRLPFDEVIDWRRVAVLLPGARLPEVHFILRSFGAADIYSLKYHGRRVFENYLATSKQIIDTAISVIALERMNFPPLPVETIKTDTHFSSSKLKIDTNCSLSDCLEARSDTMINLLSTETLGPRETPFASPKFTRNLSLVLLNTYDLWNNPLLSSQHLYPSHPNDPVPPSEFKYLTGHQGYRPIGDGQGGSGIEFSQAIGGDYPNEQFTIVILTYERINLLMKTLERLRGLAYLNKILVVWNGISQPPQETLVWPDVGVPILLVKVDKNSLNNRFLPYDAIETDAIFSMDDDSPLRPDEIVFAFRVWRESRDRIVGFPGRFHAWDEFQSSWMYNSNHSCELSMVLTGGAFFHRYYAHVYSQLMPESIRSIVDKFMNCEDIAMNFLVAHLTRKPPIKVTSRWTFHCASCPTSLSEDHTHFMERHECLNIFASIYGYMPLLNTQHRSDSILFKTRLPRDKQKCFKFV